MASKLKAGFPMTMSANDSPRPKDPAEGLRESAVTLPRRDDATLMSASPPVVAPLAWTGRKRMVSIRKPLAYE